MGGGANYAQSGIFFAPPPKIFSGANLNRKLKKFCFLDTLKVHNTLYSPITLQVLLYLFFKQTRRKKQQINFFNTFHSSVLDLKSSRGARPFPPLYTPFTLM